MQNKHSIYTFFLFLTLMILNFEGLSQKLITYKSENQPLNIVLTKIASISKVRFAFDDDYFSKIFVSFTVSNLTVAEFLKQLSVKFPVNFKFIGGTWVVYKDEKKVVERPKPKVAQKTPVKLPPLITQKVVYKKARLWDLIGTVIDVKTGNSLKYNKLLIDEYTNPLTNDLGFFLDEVVGTGDVHIKINQIGYYPLDTAFMLSDGKDIVLKLNPIWKVDNSFNDLHSNIFMIDIPENSDLIDLNPQAGTYIPGTDQDDYANSLKLLPGVFLSDGNNAGISTRGASPSETQIIMDGFPVLNYCHLSGQISTLNSKFIHQAFISRGGFGAECGGGSSGIIELTGKSGFGQALVDLSVNMLDANLFLGIPITKKISVSGSFRKSIIDYWPNYYYKNLVTTPINIQTVGTDVKEGMVHDPFNNFFDINMKVAIQPNIRNEINFIVSNGYDNQKRSYSISADKNYFMNFQSDWRNYGVGLNWKFRSRNFWYNTIVASFNTLTQKNGLKSGFEPEGDNVNGSLQLGQDLNNSTEVLLKWKSEFSFKKFLHQFGAEYNFYHLNYNYQFSDDHLAGTTQTGDSISNLNNKQLANLFYQCSYKLNKWIDFTAGVRGLIDLSMANVFIQPRAGIDLTPTDRWKLHYHFGYYVQPFYQTQRVGTDLNSVPVWFLPIKSDQYIKSYHHILGVNFNYEGLMIDIEGYLMPSSGKAAYFALRNNDDISEGGLYNICTGSENRKGVDAKIQFHHNIFNHSIAYSYSNCKDKFIGVNGDQVYPSFNNHPHRLQLSETVAFSGWVAFASFNYFTGTPYLLQNSTFEQFNLSQIPDCSQLDLSFVRQFSLKSLKIEAGAVLLNVLGNKNEKSIEYFRPDDIASNFILKSTTAGISFTPTFFINIKFD
jgi:ferric enterobactin receptor